MTIPSLRRSPSVPASDCLSLRMEVDDHYMGMGAPRPLMAYLPAKSTKLIMDVLVLFSPGFFCVKLIWTMVWARLQRMLWVRMTLARWHCMGLHDHMALDGLEWP